MGLGSVLENASAMISIITPLIILFWFFHTRKQNFNNEFIGVYAGYMDSETNNDGERIESGLILNIKDISSSGFFRGEFDYRRNLSTKIEDRMIQDGFYTFYGKVKYRLYFPKNRHLLKTKENRIYFGKLVIVMRLDFDIEKQRISDFSQEEYDFEYYREIKVLKFRLSNRSANQTDKLPEKFQLNKSLDLAFEPYKNVKQTIFRGFTRTD